MQSNVENSVSDSSVRIDPNLMRPTKPTTETETDSEQDEIITNNNHYNRPVQQYPVCNAFQVTRYRRKLCLYTQQMRMQPYYVPHRTRTKSENSDLPLSAGPETATDAGPPSLPNSTLMETGEPPTTSTMDIPMNSAALLSVARSRYPVVMLKKYRSLEDVRVDNSLEGSQPSHEMEFVSSRIQQLKVQE
ncbi:uncharacterized protein LOC128267850 [Anopheles cruzii]|uniref:uncharacterized protein LOC128267850 n=1 Tax=Anopheles cruzii TaxID=68878 RepID=UPI0022EC269F|nr:uncharacterized protein LOC128267850 [Anopheles cruzii]XP_052860758.1 uncharacterized protein LOC128267850 [Anopheles cruzii]